jgi:membrane protease YdiL (CAAX protease family)
MPQEQEPSPSSVQHENREPPIPSSYARPGMAVPKSLIVWLVVLFLSFTLPSVLHSKKDKAATRKDHSLSATEFGDLTEAETLVRSAFGIKASESLLGSFGNVATGLGGKNNQAQKYLDDGAKTYRDLLKTQSTPGIIRRIFIVDHARGKALDQDLLTKELPKALKETGVKSDKITLEQKLWRGVYGKPASVAASDLPAFSHLLQDTNLRFLKDKALVDLYTVAGKPTQAAMYEKAFTSSVTRSLIKQSALGVSLLFIGVVGFCLLIVFLIAAATKNWQLIKRHATLPQVLGWGDLLDAFIFYLAFTKAVGLIVSLLVSRLSVEPTPVTLLTLYASLQAGTGFVALLYLWRTAQKRGVTLADIGFHAPKGLLSEIGYGIGGYCAVLPLVVFLGWVSRLLFQHDQTRTPNPIMPLMAGEQDPFRRLVIFLMVAVGAPLFEELFFRGALFSGLRARYGWVLSGVISGAIFAIAHPPQDWLPIFGLGFAFATMREMRQSLVPSMTAHFLQNSLAFIGMSLIFGS